MMAQVGQHVLIVDDNVKRRGIIDIVVQRLRRNATLAKDGDEALAVLRPSLHPLIVIVHANMRYPDDADPGSLLLALLANQEFAATHAFVVIVASLASDDLSALQAAALAVAPSASVQWLPLPGTVADITAAVIVAGRYLQSKTSGQPPTP